MEVKIGIQNVVRELTIDVEESHDEVMAQFNKALADNTVFSLKDSKGQTLTVPAEKIAYLQIAAESGRKVGFGL